MRSQSGPNFAAIWQVWAWYYCPSVSSCLGHQDWLWKVLLFLCVKLCPKDFKFKEQWVEIPGSFFFDGFPVKCGFSYGGTAFFRGFTNCLLECCGWPTWCSQTSRPQPHWSVVVRRNVWSHAARMASFNGHCSLEFLENHRLIRKKASKTQKGNGNMGQKKET